MSPSLRNLATASAVALALAACSGGDSTGPLITDLAITADFAVLAADGMAEDVEMMGGPGGAHGFGLFGLAGGTLAVRDLGCRTLDRPNLSVTRSCTFADASGATQASYDATTTASVRIETTVDGDRAHDRWSATIDRSSDLTVTGLAGAETQRTWNGTGTETVSRSRHVEDQVARAYTTDGTVTITNVVIPVPHGPGNWPLSGTIVRTMTGEITTGPRAGENFSRTATITFNGTNLVTMTVNGESFEVDLAVRRAERRR